MRMYLPSKSKIQISKFYVNIMRTVVRSFTSIERIVEMEHQIVKWSEYLQSPYDILPSNFRVCTLHKYILQWIGLDHLAKVIAFTYYIHIIYFGDLASKRKPFWRKWQIRSCLIENSDFQLRIEFGNVSRIHTYPLSYRQTE